jgi:hypothetical protein
MVGCLLFLILCVLFVAFFPMCALTSRAYRWCLRRRSLDGCPAWAGPRRWWHSLYFMYYYSAYASDASRDASDGSGIADHVWSIDEIVGLPG